MSFCRFHNSRPKSELIRHIYDFRVKTMFASSFAANIRYTRRCTEAKDNTEKLTTDDTQDDKKQNKYTKQCVLDTTMYKQTQIM
jgi:hypothetical protein